MNDLKKYQRICLLIFAAFAGTAGLVALMVSAVGASEWQPRQGCGRFIHQGDTLWAISIEVGVSIPDLVAQNPFIEHEDRIPAGKAMDVCEPDESRPRLVSPDVEVSDGARAWATAVRATAPQDASPWELLYLTSIAGPESEFGEYDWNPGDAGPGGWFGSYGYVQIRVNVNWSERDEPWRNIDWLQESILHEAEAGWHVLRAPSWGGPQAWGPSRPTDDGATPPKMPPAGPEYCASGSMPKRCAQWWAVGAAALASTQ